MKGVRVVEDKGVLLVYLRVVDALVAVFFFVLHNNTNKKKGKEREKRGRGTVGYCVNDENKWQIKEILSGNGDQCLDN